MKIHNLNSPKQGFIPGIFSGIFLISSVLVLFLPVFMSWRGIFQNDQAIAEFSRHFFLARTLQAGSLPLWQPNVWCGAIPYYSFPYGGDAYYILLWPFYLLSNLNDLDSAYWTISILPLAFHYLIAAVGMYVLLRRVIECNRFAACLGAFAYIYSPAFTFSYTCLYILIMQSWLPWLILVYIMAVRDFRIWKLLFGAIIFAFICLGSKPNFIPFIFIVWSGFIIVLVLERARQGGLKSIAKPFVVALLMFILGALLSAPYLYSFLDGLRYTELGFDLTFDKAIENPAGSLSPSYLATLFVPDLFGSITGVNFISSRLMFWYANMSGGMFVTFAAWVGALFSFSGFTNKKLMSNLQKYAILGTVLYIVALLCSLGRNAPFCKWFTSWVPLFGGLPNPIRFRFLECFATSMLIGIGLHCLIRSEILTRFFKLGKILWLYVIFSSCAIGLVLFLPHRTAPAGMSAEAAGLKIEGFLPLGQAVGIYTPRFYRTKRMKVMFDGESQGEIRYSDTHVLSPEKGNLVRKYHALGDGFVELDVDIPPNSFLWIYPRSGPGRIGYWEEAPGCFRHDQSWGISAHTNSLGLIPDITHQNASLFEKMRTGYAIGRNPLLKPLLYWLLALSILIAGVYLVPIRRFGYFLSVFVLLEFLVFGLMAFYGCTFNEDNSRFREFLPHNVRATQPTAHPMTQLMLEKLPLVVPKDQLRIATDYPLYESYSYLSGKFSFMGETAFPLEKRFKRAIEAAYEQSMTAYAFYEGKSILPKQPGFLSNFSVGYFLSRDPGGIFPNESILPPVHNGVNYFVHVNRDALPRVYIMDTLISASEDRQFEELLSGDLRRAVYVDGAEKSFFQQCDKRSERDEKDYVRRFNELQSINPVTYVNFDNPNKIEIEVTIGKPSMLVLGEVWYPGWESTVDGNSEPVYRVNYCQRGIWLNQGTHRVVLRFEPLSWRVGAGISVCVMISALIFSFLFRRRIETRMKDV